jgi:WbqC-like protein
MCKFLLYDQVIIEQHENYQKRSYRNRCHVIGSHGVERLSIPLQSGKHQQQPISEVKISYDRPWFASHWNTIKSAYGRAPYFEHYGDALKEMIYSRYTYLFDLNNAILNWLVQSIHLMGSDYTTGYEKIALDSIDLRNFIHFNKGYIDINFRAMPYFQVFDDRQDFEVNLSVIDVLFALGPETKAYLRSCLTSSC